MKKLIAQGLLATTIVLGASGAALAGDENSCTLNTLHGRYVFSARGFTIVGDAAQPIASLHVMDFDGDGRVSTPRATISVNGQIFQVSPGADGTYAIDDGCLGAIQFVDIGVTLDIAASPRGNEIWMIQTNQGTVFEGTATRTLRANDNDRE